MVAGSNPAGGARHWPPGGRMLVAGDGWQHAGAVRPIKTTTFADDTLIHHAAVLPLPEHPVTSAAGRLSGEAAMCRRCCMFPWRDPDSCMRKRAPRCRMPSPHRTRGRGCRRGPRAKAHRRAPASRLGAPCGRGHRTHRTTAATPRRAIFSVSPVSIPPNRTVGLQAGGSTLYSRGAPIRPLGNE